MIPYDIKTEAGRALWNQMNQEHGSVVWGPVGEGIVAIEAEVEARIIKLLEAEADDAVLHSKFGGNVQSVTIQYCIALLKSQKDNETVVLLTQKEAEQLAKAIGEAK